MLLKELYFNHSENTRKTVKEYESDHVQLNTVVKKKRKAHR